MFKIAGGVVGLLVVIVVVALVVNPSCTKARLEVASDKVLDTIDQLIGKTEVAQKDIDNRMKALDKSKEGFRKAKITARVKAEMVGREAASVEEGADRAKAAIAKLEPHLKGTCGETGDHKIGTDTYSPQEVTDTMKKLVETFKSKNAQAVATKKAVSMLNDVAKNMETKQAQATQEYEALQGQVAELKAKTLALKTMKDAAKAMGGVENDTFSSQVTELKGKVNDLLVDVDTSLKVEQEQWDETSVTKDMNKAERLVGNLTSNTVSEVDKILGNVEPTSK